MKHPVEDYLKIKMNPKNIDDLKNEDNLKNEGDIKKIVRCVHHVPRNILFCEVFPYILKIILALFIVLSGVNNIFFEFALF